MQLILQLVCLQSLYFYWNHYQLLHNINTTNVKRFHVELVMIGQQSISQNVVSWKTKSKIVRPTFLAQNSKSGCGNTGNRQISVSCLTCWSWIRQHTSQFREKWGGRFFIGVWSLIEAVVNRELTVAVMDSLVDSQALSTTQGRRRIEHTRRGGPGRGGRMILPTNS